MFHQNPTAVMMSFVVISLLIVIKFFSLQYIVIRVVVIVEGRRWNEATIFIRAELNLSNLDKLNIFCKSWASWHNGYCFKVYSCKSL